MAGEGRTFDGEATVFDRVRRLSALARFEPGAVTPDRLAEVLDTVGGRYRRDVAGAIEHYAPRDPEGVAEHRAALLAELDEYGGTAGESLARAIGHAVAVDPGVVDVLADRLAEGSRAVAAAEGLAVAADVDPDAVAGRLSTLLENLGADPAVRAPLSRALASLYVVDAVDEGGPIRARIGRALEADGPDERAGAVATVYRAAAADCQPAVDEFHRVVNTLTAEGSGLAAEEDLDRPVVAGLRAVATERPHALVAHLDALLELPVEDPAIEVDLRAALTDVVGASSPTFERLLGTVEPGGGWLSRVRSSARDDSRTRAVLAGAAPDHVDVLVRRQPTVRAVLRTYPGLGADLVAAVAREQPATVEWAIDPLLELVDDDGTSPKDAERVAGTIADLARVYPPVAGTVVDRLATAGDDRSRAVTTARALARTAPAALAGATAPDGRSVEETLMDAVPTEDGGVEAALALADLGARFPDRLAAVADHVADAVRASSYRPDSARDRARNAMAAEAIRADPETMHSVGLTVLDQVEGEVGSLVGGEDDPNGLVALLGALCGEYERYADRVVEWYADADDAEAARLLPVFAAAGEWDGTTLTDHHPTLVEATRRLDDDQRAAAARALAGAVASDPDPPSRATARLVDLLYDNSPAVRRSAAYGVGEWLASTECTHEEPVRRLSLVADADEGTPVADLALVRAGARRAAEEVPALERVALGETRGPALAAVDCLAGVTDDGARRALDAVRDASGDRRVRAAARRVPE